MTNKLSIIKYSKVKIEIEVDNTVDGFTFYDSSHVTIFAEYYKEGEISDMLKAIKKRFGKVIHSKRAVVTIVGITKENPYGYGEGIKRYTFDNWDFKIEHRPYTVENSFSIENTTKHDTLQKMVNALIKDMQQVIENSLDI